MSAIRSWSLETQLAHVGVGQDAQHGAVTTPIFQTVTYQKRAAAAGEFDYSRTQNPTRQSLEESLAVLEGGAGAMAFSSGMAAITAVFHLLRQGDHIVLTNDLYGGTYRLLHDVFGNYGIRYSFVDTRDVAQVRAAMTPQTRMVFVETPSNPLLRISDLDAIAAVAHHHGALFVVDNTFMTFARQRPFEHGADIVVYSATKYLGGHNDVLAGAVIARDSDMAALFQEIGNATGGVLSPMDSFLLLRGLKTLGLRLDRQESNAKAVVDLLAGHPAVRQIYYPTVGEHGYRAHCRQACGCGGVLSFLLKHPEDVEVLFRQLQLVLPAVSLGGTESLITEPFSETHREFPEPERISLGIVPGLLRLSLGVESEDDIVEDLRQALNRLV